MAEIEGENILDQDTDIGVLYLGPPDGSSAYAFITRDHHCYAVRSWASLDVDYSTLIDDRDHLQRHRNGIPLVVDVTNVGRHFVKYLQQSGINDCEPVISFDDVNREPLTFKNPESELWHVSAREAIAVLHLLHGESRINFGRDGVNPGQTEAFRNRIDSFGTSEAGEEEHSLWPLAIACLIAEIEESVIPS